jgi:hypothetical protein
VGNIGNEGLPYDLTSKSKYYAILQEYVKKYGHPMSGRHRATFDRGDGWVIKVAHLPCGQDAIEEEARLSKEADFPVAHCYLETSEFNSDIDILIMEKVDPDDYPGWEHLPDWAKVIDCEQVGMTPDGRLVAYDFADYESYYEEGP